MFLVKLIDKMSISVKKFLNIHSNGSLAFCHKNYLEYTQILVYEKDNKNLYNNERKKFLIKNQSDALLSYKKKYLI